MRYWTSHYEECYPLALLLYIILNVLAYSEPHFSHFFTLLFSSLLPCNSSASANDGAVTVSGDRDCQQVGAVNLEVAAQGVCSIQVHRLCAIQAPSCAGPTVGPACMQACVDVS